MELNPIFRLPASEEQRRRNTKIVGRMARRLARKWEKNDGEDVGAEDMIDVETVLLLHKFQTAFIAGVNGSHCYVGKEYETYQGSIGRIGPRS
jgi:hypothetical protein